MTAQPKASHFVDGAYLEDKAGAPIEVIYPATGEVIAVVHEATPAVIEAALASATRVFWPADSLPAARSRNGATCMCSAISTMRCLRSFTP